MANSRLPILGLDPFELAARTPGPLGHNDAASPDSPNWLRGDTPGPLGTNDPTHFYESWSEHIRQLPSPAQKPRLQLKHLLF